ncbi:tetratricopeptide repeat protein [Nannocystaceae bacterium ST9]
MTIKLPALALVSMLAACEREPTTTPETKPETESAPACEGAERLARRWTPEREQQLSAALAELPGEWPRRVVETIDRRVAESGPTWQASYRQACSEADVARERCLERQADELDGLVTLMIRAPELADRLAPWSELALVSVAACDHAPTPHAGPIAPELGAELAVTALLFSIAEYPRAVEAVTQLADLHAIVDDPIYVFTLGLMATVLELGYGKVEAGMARFQALAPELAKVGPRERSSFEHVVAVLAGNAGDPNAAIAAYERAIAAERELGDPIRIAFALENLAELHRQHGDIAAASAALTEAIGIYTRQLGSESAHVAEAQLALAGLQAAAGKIDAAQDLLLQARDGFSAALGSDHPATHDVVLRLGRLLLAAGRPSDAYHAFLDLQEITEAQYGERDVRTADAKLELAEALRAMGEHEGARLTFLEALPILVEGHGADHRSVAQTSIHLAQSLIELGKAGKDHDRLDEAETHCTNGRSLVLALPEADPLRADAEQCWTELAAARKLAGKRKPGKPAKPAKPG